jgi:hypothetical protein
MKMDLTYHPHLGLTAHLLLTGIIVGIWGFEAKIRERDERFRSWLYRELSKGPFIWLMYLWLVFVPLDYFNAVYTERDFLGTPSWFDFAPPVVGYVVAVTVYRGRRRKMDRQQIDEGRD